MSKPRRVAVLGAGAGLSLVLLLGALSAQAACSGTVQACVNSETGALVIGCPADRHGNLFLANLTSQIRGTFPTSTRSRSTARSSR